MKKNNLLLKSIFVLMTCVFMSGCNSHVRNRIYLGTDCWQYSLDGTDENARFEPVPAEKIEKLHELVPGQKGYIWLKTNFDVPAEYKDMDLGCFLGRITMADETKVNGCFIGSTGRFPPQEFSAWNMTRYYTIPQKILNKSSNTLLVKIWVDGEGGIYSTPFIGDSEDSKAFSEQERFWNSRMYVIFAFIMIVIAGYHFVIYIRRRKDKENLVFAIINVLSSMYMTVFCIFEIPGWPTPRFNFLVFQKIFSTSFTFIFPFFVMEFINSFLKRKEAKGLYIARLAFMIVPFVAVMCAPNYIVLLKLKAVTSPLLIPPMLYILNVIVKRFLRKEKDSVAIVVGFSPIVLCVILDLLVHNFLKISGLPYFTTIGWMLAILTILVILANRFSTALNETEYLNQHLSEEVAKRTEELSSANDLLKSANEELEEHQRRADRDMKLAVYVQQSFYQRRVPELEDWDVAYAFLPMSGVSGDLYDFFVEGKKLKGIGLFDISGHGIASGLVAMLAKTVIDRTFLANKSKPLNQVVSEIDRQVVEEKADVENYFTGVLLRFNDSSVEYVNAGHPKIFYRVAKTGKTVPIEVKGKENDNAGGIIGIAGMEPTFRNIGFTMNKGDSIIMYTDCLSESRNISDVEFGQEGVREAFENSGSGSAAEKLNNVMNTFRTWTQGVQLNDDLTVIVVQKK